MAEDTDTLTWDEASAEAKPFSFEDATAEAKKVADREGAQVLSPLQVVGEGIGALQRGAEKAASLVGNLPTELINIGAQAAGRPNRLIPQPFQPGKPVLPKTAYDVMEAAARQNLAPLGVFGQGGADVAEGLAKTARKTAEGLSTPGMLATLPFAAAKPVQALFGAGIVANLPDQVNEAVKVFADPNATTAQKTEAAANVGVSALFLGLIAHGMSREQAATTLRDNGVEPPKDQPPVIPKEVLDAGRVLPKAAGEALADIMAPEPVKPEVTPDKEIEAGVNKAIAPQPKEANAETIRSDTGQPVAPGEVKQGGEADSGGDVQQPPSGPPNAPAPAEGQEGKVLLTPEEPIKRYSDVEAARKDAVPLKPGDEAPVRFHSLQDTQPHVGWYEPTKPFQAPDGGLYYPKAEGAARVSNNQLERWGFKVPETELKKFSEAGGKAFKPPKPDWQVTVQGAKGEVPGYVQIVDPRQTDQNRSPTLEALKADGHDVPDFSKLPEGKYTWAEAENLLKGQTKLTPAIQVDGKLFTGEDHLAAYKKAKESGQPDTSGAKEGFVNMAGKFISREDAAKQTGLPTAKELGKLHSTDLPKLADEISSKPSVRRQYGAHIDLSQDAEKRIPEIMEKGLSSGFLNDINEQGKLGWAEMPMSGRQGLKAGDVVYIVKNKGLKVKPGEKPVAVVRITKDGQSLFDAMRESGQPVPPIQAAKPGAKPPKIEPEPQPVEGAGGGAAEVGEIQPTGPQAGGTHGVSSSVLEQRRQQGVTAPVEPGEGISAEGSVEKGRQLLPNADPEKIMSDFEKSNRFSADDLAVARAHGEKLAQAAYKSADEHGVNSPEYEAAWEADSKWSQRLKKMSTEWHKSGMAQQGETDIDTGTFHGLRKAHFEATGKDFTPEQSKVAQEKAAKSAKAGTAAATAQDKLAKDLADKASGQTPAEKRAQAAVDKTVRDWAARRATAETKLRVAQSARGKAVAKIELDRIIKAQAAVDKTVREAASKAAELARKRQGDPIGRVWEKAKDYLAKGVDNWDDIRNKIATDLGMKVDQVTRLLAQDKQTKRLANDAWKARQDARLLREQSKRWVRNLDVPGYQKALNSIPRILFGLKVGFHGTVALGTHAPMVAFQPRFWSAYVRDFGKMYRMVGSRAYYERQVQDLVRRPNYTTARRAGLINDPASFEDYNSPDMVKYIGGLSGMGNRGYAVLKILRQDMFDQHWENLPKTAQIPQVAEAIADAVNHATGVVKGKAPPGSNVALFAPRLMASRAAWLVVDPAKSADTFARWKTATEGEKQFAINQVKEKAWVLGTAFGLLALNQGILSLTGSKQKINFDDPMKGDFMKFKAAGMDFSYGNAMLTMARLPARLYQIRERKGGKLRNVIYPDEDTYSVLGEYGRSQLSPFASLTADLWLKSDWMRRPLPSSNRPVPARLRREGVKPYTWPEFLSEQVLPIPAEEAVRQVWKSGLGMNDKQTHEMRKALATLTIMAATGARVSDDWDLKKKAAIPAVTPAP